MKNIIRIFRDDLKDIFTNIAVLVVIMLGLSFLSYLSENNLVEE